MTQFDLVVSDARIVARDGTIEGGWLGVTDGVIAAVEHGEFGGAATVTHAVDGAWVGPGFIDVHVHGSVGVDVMETDDEGMRRVSRFFARKGVTSYLAGTYTREHDYTLGVIEVMKRVVGPVSGGATILGLYMEGPFLNPVRKGAHREQLLRSIDRDEVTAYLDSGIVSAFVVAPELPGADWVIDELVRRGITPVAGHTDATYAQMAEAQERGVVAVTHAFNGMRGLHHREPGAAGAALLLDGLICEVISDGAHLAPELLNLFWRMKGAQGIAIITDAGPYGGKPDGSYQIYERPQVISGGVARLDDGTISGSAKTYDYDFALFARETGQSFDTIWPAASAVPARIAGVSDRKGEIAVGMDADLAILETDGAIVASVVGGEWIDARGTDEE